VRQHRNEFAEFYAAARDDCLRTVLASTGDRQAAEDCVAESFARAWASWRTVRAHPAPRAWIVRTALNLHVSSWRRRRASLTLTGGDRYPGGRPTPQLVFVIDPSHIPPGDALEIDLSPGPRPSPSETFAPRYPPPPAFMNVYIGGVMVAADGSCLP
jgi:DNA-directed RNA polymerase specialized sigma24 family protein